MTTWTNTTLSLICTLLIAVSIFEFSGIRKDTSLQLHERTTNTQMSLQAAQIQQLMMSGGTDDLLTMHDVRGIEGFAQTDLLVKCGAPDTLGLLIYSNAVNPIENVELELSLPAGLEYAGFVLGGVPGTEISEYNVTDLETPVFLIPEINQDSFSVVYIGVRANCQASPKNTNYNIEYASNFNYTDTLGLTSNNVISFEPSAEFNNAVKEPVLNILEVQNSNSVFTNLNSIKYQYLSISQDGISAYVDSFNVVVGNLDTSVGIEIEGVYDTDWELIPWQYDEDNLELTATVSGQHFLNNTDPLGRPADTEFDTNEQMLVRIAYKMPECHATPLQSLTYEIANFCGENICQAPSEGSGTLIQSPSFGTTPLAEANLVQAGSYCGDNIIVDAKIYSSVADSIMGTMANMTVQMSQCDEGNVDIAGVSVNGVMLPDSCFGMEGGFVELYLQKLTFDPDGDGQGLTDMDGDGRFDELPGSDTLNARIEFALTCASAISPDNCSSGGCDIYDVVVLGERHCGQDFQLIADVEPSVQFNFGTTTSTNETAINSTVSGINFGSVSSTAPKTRTIQICYETNPVNITSCPDAVTRMEVTFKGRDYIIDDMEASATEFEGTAVPFFFTTIDDNTKVLTLQGGSSVSNTEFCYNFDITLDECVCAPPDYTSVDAKIIQECTGACTCTVLAGCAKTQLYTDYFCTGCSCDIYSVATVERLSTGYTDQTKTTKLTPSQVDPMDANRFMPGDTAKIIGTHEILNADNVNNGDFFWDFIFQNRRSDYAERTTGTTGMESLFDAPAAELLAIKYVKTATQDTINVGELLDCLDNAGSWWYGPHNSDDVGLQPGLPLVKPYNAATNSGTDNFDGMSLRFRLWNFDVVENNSNRPHYNTNSAYMGDCITPFLDIIGGAVETGDFIIVEAGVPLVKNPEYDPAEDVGQLFRTYMYAYNWLDGPGIHGTAATPCITPMPYEFHDPSVVVENSMTINECGADIFHTYKISNPPPATWYENEYRPIFGMEQMSTDLPDPLFFANNAELIDNQGNVRSLTLSETDFEPNLSNYTGTNYYSVNTENQNKARLIFKDAEFANGVQEGYSQNNTDEHLSGATFPLLGVGGGIEDEFTVRIPTIRLCDDAIDVTDLEVAFDYSYQYLPDLNHRTWLCNDESRVDCDKTASYAERHYWNNRQRGDELNPHRRLGNQSTVYNVTDISIAKPAMTAFVTSPVLVDIEGNNETNTYTICTDNTGAGTHENVFTVIALPNSIQLLDVLAANGQSVNPSLVKATETEKIYNIMMADIGANECQTLTIQTEQLYCVENSSDTRICIKTSSGCLDSEQSAALLGQTEGGSCSSAGDCYIYDVLEADVQAEWVIQPTGTYPLCDEIELGIRVKNVKPALLSNLQTTWWLPEGLTPVDGSWKLSYPNGPNNQEGFIDIPNPVTKSDLNNAYGNAYGYLDDNDFSDFLGNNGLQGISPTSAVTDSNQFVIKFLVETTCDAFTSGYSARFNLGASGPCEITVNSGTVESNPIIIDGANPLDFAQFLILADPVFLNCGAAVTQMSITGLNVGDTGASQNTVLEVVLPEGIDYAGGGIEFTSPSNFTPQNFTAVPFGNSEKLTFDIPDGIGPYGYFDIRIPITAAQNANCGDLELGMSAKSYIPDQVCVTGGTCGVFVDNTVNNIVPITIKGPLNAEDIKILSECENDPDQVLMSYEILLSNPAETDYTENINVQIIQDLNGNNIADDYETVLGETNESITVAAGGELLITNSLWVPESGFCPSIIKINYNSDCACDFEEEIINTVIPAFFDDLGESITLCPGDDLRFAICGDYDFSLTPASAGTLTETADSIFITINPGQGVAAPVIFGVEGMLSQCDLDFRLPIYNTETFEIGPYDTKVVCETGCTKLNLNLPSAWDGNVSVEWSPTDFLDDPTSETPNICDPTYDVDYTVTVTNIDGGCIAEAVYAVIANPTTINSIAASDCYYDTTLGNVSDVNIVIEWAMPAPNDVIEVSVGNQTQSVNPNTASQPASLNFTFPADASTQDVLVNYSKNASCQDASSVILPSPCAFDYGDLPDATAGNGANDYQTTAANNGASHVLLPQLYLGASVDFENDGQTSMNADGDGDDEDGLTLTNGSGYEAGDTIQLPVSFVNTTGTTAYLIGYIDWNADGEFTNDEIVANISSASSHSSTIDVIIPADAAVETFNGVRFRLSQTADLSAEGPSGFGEIEDYWITVYQTASIGNYVWEDTNVNGIQDESNTGIEGVEVTLTGIDYLGNTVTSTTTTNSTGYYEFTDLIPGDYELTFSTPTDYDATIANNNTGTGTDENDSDIDPITGLTATTTLSSGENDTTWDAGFYQTATIGNYVWEDTNANGIQDETNTGIENVEVLLTGTDNFGNDVSLTTTTNSDGFYEFTNLVPGDYELTFGTPTNYVATGANEASGNDTNDSDANISTGTTATTSLESGENDPTWDAGFYQYASIGNYVWEDTNANGVQDNGEPGIGGVEVTLTGIDGLGNTVLLITTTNPDGSYSFENLVPGDYELTFETPTDYLITGTNDPSSNGNGDDIDDSDASTVDGTTMTTTLVSGEDDATWDAGFYEYASIGDFVWEDYNANGIQDAGEPGIEGVEVTLTGIDGLGNAVSLTTTTDSDGLYSFENLVPGEYNLTFVSPTDMQTSTLDVNIPTNDDSNDSDANPDNNWMTITTILISNEDDDTWDAGFYATDFGDNPDSFATTNAENGAVHVINPNKYLGAGVDAENNGIVYNLASGDDDNASQYNEGTVTNGDDEDGIIFKTPLIPGYEACIDVTAQTGSETAYLTGWIDFNGDGDFDTNEQLEFTAGIDAPITTGTTEYCFTVPLDATFEGGETHSRFRLSCETGVAATGQIIGGEVEDYYIPLTKVGNLVWQDTDNEGDQDEPANYGLDGIVVLLNFAGNDGIIGTADDIIYTDTTSTVNGVAGQYCFSGLTVGDYEVSLEEYPANFQEAPIDATGDDTTDNDGDNFQFTITDPSDNPTGENSTGDNPGAIYPDSNDDLTIDIALVAFDFGDLPEEFATYVDDNGAYHVLEPGFFLGGTVDAELDGNPDADAGVQDGGDNSEGAQDPLSGVVPNDEQGVQLVTPLIPGNQACIEISASIPSASGDAYFTGWIDFNGDGDFAGDANEALVFNEQAGAAISANNQITYSNSVISQQLCFDVPADATFDGGETHFRYRLGREQNVGFAGEVNGGEVEDYWMPLAKVGNLVWREYDEEGDQDEENLPNANGLNDIQVDLVYAGQDGILGNADDITYSTITAQEDGINGKYNFCGLPAGNYQVNIPNPPADLVVSPTNTTGNPSTDADPLSVDIFIDNPQTLFAGENGTGDDAPTSFPDNADLLFIDFAFSALDYGDLPTSFTNTINQDNGAYHVINPSIYLGQGVDAETNGAPQAESGVYGVDGDDQTISALNEGAVATGNDEDGIEFISPLIPGEKAYVRVTSHTSNNDAVLNAWLDFDGDGTFAADGSEQISWTGTDATTYTATTEGAIPQGDNTQIFCFEVPEDAIFDGGETHARFRLSTAGGLNPTGKSLDGEVEDYYAQLVKVGNLVWRDLNLNGQQDPEDLGINDIEITLTTEGPDGIIGTTDDYVYTTTSVTVNGQDGIYNFCGLPAGDYTVSSAGDGSLTTETDAENVPDDVDSDGTELVENGVEVIAFTITPNVTIQPEDENGIGDNPTGTSFPDNQNNLTFDFGYQGLDYGDLPNTFVTLQEDGGASHVLIDGIFLGETVDLDIDGVPTGQATGDNTNPSAYTIGAAATGGDDEEGITFLTPMIPGETATIAVSHTATFADAYLNAWIDWNGDGIFAADGSEQVEWISPATTPTKEGLLPTGTNVTQNFTFNVPTNATFEGGETHIRFRMSTAGNLTPTGLAFNGEVEDYWLPMANAGNVVWFDEDLYGDEDEASTNGIDDLEIELVYAGHDGVFGNADDIIYAQTTSTVNGQAGSYLFFGLIDGTYTLQYTEYPEGMISTVAHNTDTDMDDSDGDFDFETFTITNGAQTSVIGENQAGDDTNPNNYPDTQTNVSVDFGFVNTPRLASSLSLRGVQEPSSGACGNFDGIYQNCIVNNGDAPLSAFQVMLDFASTDAFGTAFIGLGETPVIISSTAQTIPAINPAFTGGGTGQNLFDGTSGLLYPGEEVCVQFAIELRPIDEAAPAELKIQGSVSAGAVNYDGTPIPDVLNGFPQFIAEDLTDDGTNAEGTNPDSPNDQGTADDPSLLSDCWEANALACNDLLQVSLGALCEAGVTPDMLLENLDPACGLDALPLGSWYTVTLFNGAGQPLPNNEITADMYNEPISVQINHIVSCNDCYGSIVVEDKDAPEFDCPTDIITVDCTDDIDAIPAPIAMDNCELAAVTLVDESVNDDEACTSVIVTREWTAFDEQGNQSAVNCIQTIEILPVTAIDLPKDIVWSCEQYAAHASLTNPTALTVTGLTSNSNFSDALDATLATNTTQLASTGSGQPNLGEGTYCTFTATHTDEILSTCGSENTFKIIRTWTVLNYCTNELITVDADGDDNVQIIKIIDNTAPVISIEDLTVSANLAQTCSSTAALPAAIITDACSTISDVQIATPIGTIFGNGGNIPEPGLPIGTHNVTYIAIDACGNTSELTIELTVIDDVTPTAVCEEITQVALSSEGISTVDAATFDDGSNDNCGVDYFEVRRMTDNCGIAGNTTWGESVDFCCADLDQEVQVAFRVYDYYGNFNDCMVNVLVEDKLAPIKIAQPEDFDIDCDDYFQNIAPALDIALANGDINPQILIDLFGQAVYDDNCDAIVTTTWTQDVNSCGEGTIIRTWWVVDPSGNVGQTCSQNININHVNDWNISFPADMQFNCVADMDELAGEDFGEPTIFDDDCELIAISIEDQLFNVVEDACYKVLRTYTAINWCVYDGDNQDDDATIGTRRFADGGDGIVTYIQQIMVVDEVAPVITPQTTLEYCIDGASDADADCDRNITLPEAAIVDCSDDVTVTYTVETLGTGRNYANVTPGTYTAIVTATDNCGNQNSNSYDFEVRDCKAPTPYCVSNLIVELMPMDENGDGIVDNGMVEIWATDFNLGSYDNCTAAEDLTFTATIGEDNANAATTNILFDCTTTGAQNIYLYVTDEAGNTDYCLTTVFIESVDNVCPEVPSTEPEIAGVIMTEDNVPVELTEVNVNGSTNSMMMTTENGQHSTNVTLNGDYTVIPHRDDDHDNGVTTFDIVLIRQHVLTTSLLDSPYKMIAADVNNSGSITTSDIVLLRQLILTVIDELPSNTSWRFVDADYEFPNPQNPWAEEFPEVISYNNIAVDQSATDFIAVKIGDVNGNVQANFTQDADERGTGNVIFRSQDANLAVNETIEVELTTDTALKGYQFTLDFDMDALEFVGIGEEMRVENFGLTKLEKGSVTVSIDNETEVIGTNKLIFKALKATNLSNSLAISSRFTQAVGYTANGNSFDIQLEFTNAENAGFALYQNTPNPWTDATTIGFDLPKAATAEIRIHDAIGRTLRVLKGDFAQGYNEVKLDGKGLDVSTILFYTIEADGFMATKAMVRQ